MKQIVLLLGIFVFCFAQAQTQTSIDTIYFEVYPDSVELSKGLKLPKDSKITIKENYVIVICENDSKTIDKVMKDAAKLHLRKVPREVVFPKNTIDTGNVFIKYDPKIDSILNVEDSTIFFDDIFLTLDTNKVHPRSRNYCSLIKSICQFRKKLEILDNMNLRKLRENAKESLDDLSDLAEKISSDSFKTERLALTSFQKEYYNNLYYNYVEYWRQFNP